MTHFTLEPGSPYADYRDKYSAETISSLRKSDGLGFSEKSSGADTAVCRGRATSSKANWSRSKRGGSRRRSSARARSHALQRRSKRRYSTSTRVMDTFRRLTSTAMDEDLLLRILCDCP